MGCFNMFCAVSGAVIGYGDPIVVIGLNPRILPMDFDVRDDDIWTDAAYTAPALPLFGKYDDYGGIELSDYQMTGAVETFRKEIKLSRNPHDEDPATAEIHNNNYRLMFIHRSVYDRMVSLQRPYVKFRSGMRPLDWVAYDEMVAKMKSRWDMLGYDEKFGKFDPGIMLTMASNEFFQFCHIHDYKAPRDMVVEMINSETPVNSRFVNWYHSVKWMFNMSHVIGFRIAPSLYAGQTVEIADREWVDEEIAKLREAEKERFNEE